MIKNETYQMRIMTNNKDILTRIVLKYSDGLKRFAHSLCRNETDSEDLVSETVVKAYENLHQLKDEGKTKQWLFRILNNQFISSYRLKIKYSFQQLPADNDGSFSLYEQIEASNFADTTNPEKNFIKKVTSDKIHEAINELPEEFRIALTLCDMEDFSYAEIAVITRVPVGTVRSRISRARNLLQKKLWVYAQEMGIIHIEKARSEKEYVCTCGNEEIKHPINIPV